MRSLLFLLEEPSMKAALEPILPKILPEGIVFQLVPHEGKSDLDRSIPRKLRAWKTPGTKFVVLRDQHGADCKELKRGLTDACAAAGRPDTLVRIVCQELESWFLGDLPAIESAFALAGLSKRSAARKYRDPDALMNASDELEKLTQVHGKVGRARAIAPHLSIGGNKSRSFNVFLGGLQRVLQERV